MLGIQPGPLEEQPTLLTAKPVLQPLWQVFKKETEICSLEK